MTPNTLNGDPAKFGLSQPDSYKDDIDFTPETAGDDVYNEASMDEMIYEMSARKSAREQPTISARGQSAQQSARGGQSFRGGQSDEFVLAPTPTKVPPMNISAMNQTKDERISNLEQELLKLKSATPSYRSGGGTSRSMSASAFVSSARGNQSMTSTNRIPTKRLTGRSSAAVSVRMNEGFVSSARRTTPNFTQTNASIVKSKGGDTARSNSSKQVTARRENSALAAEIASVRDL